MTTRLVAGCMTGTSIDSIDAALVRVEGTGLAMSVAFVRGVSRPLGELAPRLRKLADQEPMTAGEIAALSRQFSLAHVAVLRELLDKEQADLIAVHGQTVFHKPPVSWQMLTPAVIARELGVTVVCDLRAADLAAGGQGAPITPISDWVFFRRLSPPLAIVNLGGFCNVTIIVNGPDPGHFDRETMEAMATAKGRVLRPGEIDYEEFLWPISGLDLCPCNQLLDKVARKMFFAAFDQDGARASQGQVHDEALEDLEGIFASLSRMRRSLGTGDETGDWVSRWLAHVSGENLAATACEVIGRTIGERLSKNVSSILLAGGGIKNQALRRAIESHCLCRVQTTDQAGLPAAYREAAAMAVLGGLCQDRVPITLPQVTRLKHPAPIAGLWVHP